MVSPAAMLIVSCKEVRWNVSIHISDLVVVHDLIS